MTFALPQRALRICIVAVLLAGCGGSQPPIGAMAQTSTIATHTERGTSWMLPGTSGEDLLYAVEGCSGTCVVSYPEGQVVGSLDTAGTAICADDDGNVFIGNNDEIVGYAHGATVPFTTLSVPGSIIFGCGIDPSSHDLAVAYVSSSYDVAIFPDETGSPKLLGPQHLTPINCGYDDKGNLFVNGYDTSLHPALAELLNGSSTFVSISVSRRVGPLPGRIQWDGTYITYQNMGNGPRISRLKISGSKATIVGVTTIKGIKRYSVPSWIYGNQVLIPYADHTAHVTNLGAWNYPVGRKRTEKLDFGSYRRTLDIQGVVLSVPYQPGRKKL